MEFTLHPTGSIPDLSIEFSLFSAVDPLHRGLFRLDLPDRTETAIFSPGQPHQRFSIGRSNRSASFANFMREGVTHILLGFDHVLFLVALLLPSVFRRQDGKWHPEPAARPAAVRTIQIVTAFTVAHSVTLSLAAFGLVEVPSKVIEPLIALSVFLAALNNLWEILPGRAWTMAFSFGLIHGFGFAGALGGLELGSGATAITLLAFNLGVEAGQLAIVFVLMPILFRVRRSGAYQKAILPGGSILIAALAVYWIVDRLSA